MSEQASHHGGVGESKEDGCPSVAQGAGTIDLPVSRKCPVLILMEISPHEELLEYGDDQWDLLESLKGKERIQTGNKSALTRIAGV